MSTYRAVNTAMSTPNEPPVHSKVVFSSKADMDYFLLQLKCDNEMNEAEDYRECCDTFRLLHIHCAGTTLFENLTIPSWYDFVMSFNAPVPIDIQEYIESDDELSS